MTRFDTARIVSLAVLAAAGGLPAAAAAAQAAAATTYTITDLGSPGSGQSAGKPWSRDGQQSIQSDGCSVLMTALPQGADICAAAAAPNTPPPWRVFVIGGDGQLLL